VFVVNKADREGAEAAARDLVAMIGLGGDAPWRPPVVLASASTGAGVQDVWAAIELHRACLEEDDRLAAARARRLALEVSSLATERLRGDVAEALEADEPLREDLAERRIDPYRAAAALLERLPAREGGG
jgi:LAO/AO transport system kinase